MNMIFKMVRGDNVEVKPSPHNRRICGWMFPVGAATFGIMTLSREAFNILTPIMMTFTRKTHSTAALSSIT